MKIILLYFMQVKTRLDRFAKRHIFQRSESIIADHQPGTISILVLQVITALMQWCRIQPGNYIGTNNKCRSCFFIVVGYTFLVTSMQKQMANICILIFLTFVRCCLTQGISPCITGRERFLSVFSTNKISVFKKCSFFHICCLYS